MDGCERTEEEVYKILDACSEAIEKGGNFSGLTYEDGVKMGIEWLMGHTDINPLEE